MMNIPASLLKYSYIYLVIVGGFSFTQAIKGAGDVKFPMYLSILSMWGISALLCFLLGYVAGLDLVGIWIAFAADETTRAIFFAGTGFQINGRVKR